MQESISPTERETTSTMNPKMDTSQQDLFFESLDLDQLRLGRDQVCLMVADATAGLSRDRVADQMTALGCTTSKSMIDAWASSARSGHNLPFYLVAPFETACRTTQLTDWLVALRGGSASYGAAALRREIAEEMALLQSERAEFTRRINSLRGQLKKLP